MRDLDENEIYYTGSLNKNQLEVLLDWLKKNDRGWEDYSIDGLLEINGTYSLLYSDGSWCWSGNTFKTKNAKELFYTLENVQVDCTELTKECIKEMADVFDKTGYKYINGNKNAALKVENDYKFLYLEEDKEIVVGIVDNNKTTITYEKFMELFSDTLVGDVIKGTETTDEVSPIRLFFSREKKLKKTLKYLLKRDIILTPKQYKKLWKKS